MHPWYYKGLEDETWCITSYIGSGETQVKIPETYGGRPITILNDDLFAHHGEIESVIIPDTVTNIGSFCFDGCDRLRELRLPSSLTDMWQYAIARCGIEEITVPDHVETIVPFTFQDCKNLKKVILPAGLRRIYGKAFLRCESLREVILPKTAEINPEAFEGCPDIRFEYIA